MSPNPWLLASLLPGNVAAEGLLLKSSRQEQARCPRLTQGHVHAGGAESPVTPNASSVAKHHQATPDFVQDKTKGGYNFCDATATQAGERDRSRREKTHDKGQTLSPRP